jgi:hypothetical protein
VVSTRCSTLSLCEQLFDCVVSVLEEDRRCNPKVEALCGVLSLCGETATDWVSFELAVQHVECEFGVQRSVDFRQE